MAKIKKKKIRTEQLLKGAHFKNLIVVTGACFLYQNTLILINSFDKTITIVNSLPTHTNSNGY